MLLVALPTYVLVAALLVGCQRSGGDASVDAGVIAIGDTAPEADAEDQQAAADSGTPAHTVDAESGASDSSSQQPTLDTSTRDPIVAEEWVAPRPEDLSSGPLLVWREIEAAGEGLFSLQSTSDGRVVAWGHGGDSSGRGSGHVFVTRDGSRWEAVSVPGGISLVALASSGDRWAVAGIRAADDATAVPLWMAGRSAQSFVSDDRGATWSELRLSHFDRGTSVPEFAVAVYNPTAIAMDGETTVVAAVYSVVLDVPALLVDRGLLPPSKAVAHWWPDDDSLEVYFVDDSADDGVPGRALIESDLRVPLADLRLAPEQRELIDSMTDDRRVVIFAGDGTTLTQVASYEAWAVASADGDEGFMLSLFSEGGTTLLTSPDGRSWASHPSLAEGFVYGASLSAFADGVIWEAASQPDGLVLASRVLGEPAREIASFPGVTGVTAFDAGSAGLAASAALVPPALVDASRLESLMPAGRIAKDGYELRFNEPEGGMTLWDLTADDAVYVFASEVVQGDDLPDGVREEVDGDTTNLVFDDPATGEPLVVFTQEDVDPVLASAMEAAVQYWADDWPEMWVGWSADGSAWGWQTATDAFDVDGVPGVTALAVGADFVVAVVQDIEPRQGLPLGAEADSFDPWENIVTRWYVAHTR